MRPRYPRVFQASSDLSVERVGRWALEHGANRLLFVVPGGIDGRKDNRYHQARRAASEILGTDLLEEFEADAWPVTQLFGHTSTVFVGLFSASVLGRLVRKQPRLHRWLDTGRLPEDICFFRAGAPMPRFASVTHEGEAYFFTPKPPSFVRKAEFADGMGDSVPVGRYFCSVPKK